MTSQQIQALRTLAQIFIDAVKVAGDMGAPGGVLYSAVLGKITLSQFNQIMGTLVSAGKLRKSGELYFFVADL